MRREAKKKQKRKYWTRRVEKNIQKAQGRKSPKTLKQLLRVPADKPLTLKKVVQRYKALRKKIKAHQRANQKPPRGAKKSLSSKEMRLYRKLVLWITSNTERGKRDRILKQASTWKIAGSEERLVRGLIRVAYYNPQYREEILELILDPSVGWEMEWRAQPTDCTV